VARTSSSELAALFGLLGLTDEETLAIFAVDPLSLISGELDHRPELPILAVLAHDAAERAGPQGLRRWMRAGGPAGRPIDLLVAGDFAGFEDALGGLAERGLVLRSTPSPSPSPRAATAADSSDPAAADRRAGARPTAGPGTGD
jgi:hypothetical protein